MTVSTHHDPTGPFGYTPDSAGWGAEAGEALQRAHNFADAAARSIADWVVARIPIDAFREDHYRRARAAERYASAVFTEAQGLPRLGSGGAAPRAREGRGADSSRSSEA